MPKMGRDRRLLHGGTVATQHTWYFWKRGIFLKPRKLFATQLVTQLKLWQSAGEEIIILFAGMNENIYTGSLGRHLWSDGLLMDEQTLRSTGREVPHSHQSGQVAIVGTVATPGIVCTNPYLSPQGTGIEDHRFQIHDFDAHLVLGREYPMTVCPSGRALRCKVTQTVNNYNKVLKQLLVRHQLFENGVPPAKPLEHVCGRFPTDV